MRAALTALVASALPLAAHAEATREPGEARPAALSIPVIGGTTAPLGKWPDVAAVNDAYGEMGCTGTLIAPNVVLTAGHCMDINPGSVLVGAASLARQVDGEVLAVARRIEYPSSWQSFDLGLLVLGTPSRFPPRPIATGWARFDIKDGATAAIVGYGAIDRNASQYVSELQEATTTITDADCSSEAGCNTAAQPAGELGAGGMGIDTCPGDSGGPLYIVTDYGTFLAGVTSRGYTDNQYYCSEGGIYVRPDKVVGWIEEQTGATVARGPEPSHAPRAAVRGHAAETQIVPNDPRSSSHRFEITQPPAYGTARVRDDGRVRVCTNDNVAGDDVMVVAVTDTSDPTRTLSIRMPIQIDDGDPGSDCDPEDFGDSGGCCDSGRSSGGALPLALGVLVVLRRRRGPRP